MTKPKLTPEERLRKDLFNNLQVKNQIIRTAILNSLYDFGIPEDKIKAIFQMINELSENEIEQEKMCNK